MSRERILSINEILKGANVPSGYVEIDPKNINNPITFRMTIRIHESEGKMEIDSKLVEITETQIAIFKLFKETKESGPLSRLSNEKIQKELGNTINKVNIYENFRSLRRKIEKLDTEKRKKPIINKNRRSTKGTKGWILLANLEID